MNTSRFLVAVRRRCALNFSRPQLLLLASSPGVRCRLQSTQPIPAARLPFRVKLTAGKSYAWCACGHSNKQPFCDGAHRSKSPSISPLRFTPDRDSTVMLCACKQTKNAPYCDGSHFKRRHVSSCQRDHEQVGKQTGPEVGPFHLQTTLESSYGSRKGRAVHPSSRPGRPVQEAVQSGAGWWEALLVVRLRTQQETAFLRRSP